MSNQVYNYSVAKISLDALKKDIAIGLCEDKSKDSDYQELEELLNRKPEGNETLEVMVTSYVQPEQPDITDETSGMVFRHDPQAIVLQVTNYLRNKFDTYRIIAIVGNVRNMNLFLGDENSQVGLTGQYELRGNMDEKPERKYKTFSEMTIGEHEDLMARAEKLIEEMTQLDEELEQCAAEEHEITEQIFKEIDAENGVTDETFDREFKNEWTRKLLMSKAAAQKELMKEMIKELEASYK